MNKAKNATTRTRNFVAKITTLKKLVGEGSLEKALKNLEDLDTRSDKKYENTIILLKMQLNEYSVKKRRKTISDNELNIERNQIAQSILEISDNLESHEKAYKYIRRVDRERVILLAGAGLSDELGYEIIKNLPELIYENIKNVNNHRYKEAAELIDRIWENVISPRTVENVIDTLNLFSANTKFYEENEILKEKLPLKDLGEIYNAKKNWKIALELCYKVLYDKYNHNCFKSSPAVERFINLIKILCHENADNNLHIFTTNYDCLFQALSNDISFSSQINIFRRINSKGEFDGENWHLHKVGKITHPNKEKVKLPSIFIERLHGCVAWYFDPSVKYGMTEELNYQKNLMGLKLTSKGLGEQIAFANAFNHFRERLELCKKLIVCGHSFRDLEVLVEIVRTYNKNAFEIEIINRTQFMNRLDENIRKTLRGQLESRFADNINIKGSKLKF